MIAQSKKPHFLLVPGGWHTPEHWAPARAELTKLGYESTAMSLPSVGMATYDMKEDVEAIHTAAKSLADRGEDVVVVVHSYSGQPGSDAMKGLSKLERTGSNGAVVRIVFIMAYVVPEEFQPAQRDDYAAAPDWMIMDKEKGLTTVEPEDAKKVFYNDVSSEEGDKWVSLLRPWSIGCSFSKSTYAGWKHIPSTFVLCTNDQSAFGPWARPMLEGARADKDSKIDTVEEVDASHCVMVSQPVWTAQMLDRAAKSSA